MEGDAKKGGTVIGWIDISIHSLRMEGDAIMPVVKREVQYFNPLPPHGGRREIPADWNCHEIISIHSLRMEGDFVRNFHTPDRLIISIHSLRMEGDI